MLKHLFIDGEFVPRERLLAGLTLEQVTTRPGGAPHSIYDELWHAAAWQDIVVDRDEVAGAGWANDFPTHEPTSEEEWQELVERFLAGTRRAVEWESKPERLAAEVEPGETLADALHSLAVHNAYHLGKIVSLRQTIGAWPPA